ncbi:MAG: hypothetical protein ACLP6E_18935 [Acidimicrobiales bacterium]
MNRPWWQSHAPAELSVDGSGQRHRLRWQDGALLLLDHDDPDGERTLAALGGDPCECVEMLGYWERHRDDLRLLVLASRGAGDPIVHVDEMVLRRARTVTAVVAGGVPQNRLRRAARRGPGGWVSHAPLARFAPGPVGLAGGVDQDELLTLLRLGGGLSDRLVATVIAVWTDRISTEDERVGPERAALTAALFGRVTMALRGWLNEPNLKIDLEMIEPGGSPELMRVRDGLQVRLPFRWLLDVWERGVSVVLGRFATNLLDSEDERQRVLTVSPDLRDIRPVTISIG